MNFKFAYSTFAWLRTIWKDPVWSKVIATGILIIIGYVLKDYNFRNLFLLISTLLPWLDQSITIKIYYIFGMIFIPALFGVYIGRARNNHSVVKEPSWKIIDMDRNFGINWRWENISFEKVKNIRPFCQKCDFELKTKGPTSHYVQFVCFNCHCPIKLICKSYNETIDLVRKRAQHIHRQALEIDQRKHQSIFRTIGDYFRK